jgi:hypothetical protein
MMQQQQQYSGSTAGTGNNSSLTAHGKPAAAAPGATRISHTPSGTPAIPMQHLPRQPVGSSSSSTAGGAAAAAGSKLDGLVQPAAVAATPPAVPLSSPVGSTIKAELLKGRLQHQGPAGTTRVVPPGSFSAAVESSHSAAIGVSQEGLVRRHPKQPGTTATELRSMQRVDSKDRAVDSSSSSDGGGNSSGGSELGFFGRIKHSLSGYWQGTKRSVGGFWERTKRRVAEWSAWLLNELLYGLWVVLQWMAWLLLYPFKAVFGPWYRYNR